MISVTKAEYRRVENLVFHSKSMSYVLTVFLRQPVAEFQFGNSLLPFFKIRIDRINFAFT